MKLGMWISVAVLLIGIAVIGLYDPMAARPEAGATGLGRFGPALVVPLGYVLAVAGAAGLFIAWVLGRRR